MEQLLADHPLLSSLQLWSIKGLATRRRLHYRLAHRFHETQVMKLLLTSAFRCLGTKSNPSSV